MMTPHSKLVSSVEAEAMMFQVPEPTRSDVVKALEEFGTMHLETLRETTTGLDGKATACLGWASATVAYLILGVWKGGIATAPAQVAVVVWPAIVCSLVACGLAFDALRPRDWHWPSERDWFCQAEFAAGTRVRMHHVMSLLETSRAHGENNAAKAKSLGIAILAQLIATGIAVAITIVQPLVS